MPIARVNLGCVWLLLLSTCLTSAVGQTIQDPEISPLLPAWISRDEAQFSGDLLYIWPEDDNTHVLHYIGGFEMRLGGRILRARQAVVWMTPQHADDRPYQSFSIFLWQDATIRYPGATQSNAPALFATAETFGKVKLTASKQAYQSNEQSVIYQDASEVRDAYLAGELAPAAPVEGTGVLSTIDLGGRRRRAPEVRYRGDVTSQRVDGEIIATASSGFYLARGTAADQDYTEVQAEAAVLFLAPANGEDEDVGDTPVPAEFGLADSKPTGVYLEGDVILTRGDRLLVRAEKLYYDLENNRALISDPILRMDLEGRPVPIYVRASEARQLSSAEYSAQNARVSTSEFYTPHYHIGAEKLYFASESSQSALPEAPLTRAGEYRMEDTSFNIGGWPILYWPVSTGNFREGESAFRSLRVGIDDNFGFQLESRWQLFPLLLNQSTPQGFRFAYFDLDFYSDRGFGAGVESEYEFDKSFGEFRGYYIYDWADDDNLGGLRDDVPIPHPNRGRATWRHRQYLGSDWDLTLEGSYLSDENFLEEYFEKEFEDGKQQDTYIQLRRQRDNWAFTLIAEVRINNWLEDTERLPESTFRLVGAALGPLTFFSENRAGSVRYRPDERRVFISEDNTPNNRVRSSATVRGDTRQELEWPFMIGPLSLVPFATARGSYWDDTPRGSHLNRAFGMTGLRSSLYLSRVFGDLTSDLLNLSGLRHIIKLDFTGWVAAANHGSEDLFPFDDSVEEIDDFSGTTFGLRHRWQTRRGVGDKQRVVEWLLLDLQAGFFTNAQPNEFTNGFASYTRPEESITSNYVSADLQWRIGDTTLFLADANMDTDEGDLDIVDLSLAVERTPRFSYFTGWRYIGETASNLFGFGFNYRLHEKHAVAFRTYFDLDRGQTEQLDLAYIRRFPRWNAAFTFELDEIEDNTGVSVSIWPQGFPGVALGSKRYTGLATSTAIIPD